MKHASIIKSFDGKNMLVDLVSKRVSSCDGLFGHGCELSAPISLRFDIKQLLPTWGLIS